MTSAPGVEDICCDITLTGQGHITNLGSFPHGKRAAQVGFELVTHCLLCVCVRARAYVRAHVRACVCTHSSLWYPYRGSSKGGGEAGGHLTPKL